MSHRAFFERWFAELWDARNPGIIDECVADGCVIIGLPDTTDGRKSFHEFFDAFGAAFPEVHIEVDDTVEEGERFAARCSGYVVDHDGKRHPLVGSVMGKIRDGQMVEAYNQWDFLGLVESMGATSSNVLSSVIGREKKRLLQ